MVNMKPRGAVSPNKKQVNWRIRNDLLSKAQGEAKEKGFKSVTAFLEHILVNRYYPEEKAGG